LRGIPPQILKAQIQKESNFREDAFRYEPLTSDFAEVSTTFLTESGDLRIQKPFAAYHVQTFADSEDAALPQGTGLKPVEIGLRNRFSVLTDASGNPIVDFNGVLGLASVNVEPITPVDPPISMENILIVNEQNNHWICSPSPVVCTDTIFDYLDFRDANNPFTAQTVIAASFGLMQMMYTTAVRSRGYVDSAGVGLQPS